MSIAITQIIWSKNPVLTNEKTLIQVKVANVAPEPIMYRLPYRLGKKKGGIK